MEKLGRTGHTPGWFTGVLQQPATLTFIYISPWRKMYFAAGWIHSLCPFALWFSLTHQSVSHAVFSGFHQLCFLLCFTTLSSSFFLFFFPVGVHQTRQECNTHIDSAASSWYSSGNVPMWETNPQKLLLSRGVLTQVNLRWGRAGLQRETMAARVLKCTIHL